MDPSSYRLSVTALAISIGMIAAFFVALRRSVPLAELRWWTYGWLANAAAQAITVAFWFVQPPASAHRFVFALYLFPRLLNGWLMLRGALELRGRRPRLLEARVVVPWLAAFCVVGLFWITARERLGTVGALGLAITFGAGAIALSRSHVVGARWLAGAMAIRALLAGVEHIAYLTWWIGPDTSSAFTAPASAILAAHNTFDTAAEFLVAMGCVLAVTERTQFQLRQANDQMLAAQDNLRRLADRDPLTALANRRALPDVFRAVQPRGATLIFFDLNDFKRVNDEHGHQAGDLCLQRFAGALTDSFRPDDAVIRYGGDEFLVVAAGLDEAAVKGRIEALRTKLRTAPAGSIPVRFAHGVAILAPGGNPDEALRAADAAMYRVKPGGWRLAVG